MDLSASLEDYIETIYHIVEEKQVARAKNIAEEDKITMSESWMDVTFKDGNRIRMEEVAVQHWEGDQIIKERFYYNPGPMGSAEPNQ